MIFDWSKNEFDWSKNKLIVDSSKNEFDLSKNELIVDSSKNENQHIRLHPKRYLAQRHMSNSRTGPNDGQEHSRAVNIAAIHQTDSCYHL